jgi:hypothetical protein
MLKLYIELTGVAVVNGVGRECTGVEEEMASNCLQPTAAGAILSRG